MRGNNGQMRGGRVERKEERTVCVCVCVSGRKSSEGVGGAKVHL